MTKSMLNPVQLSADQIDALADQLERRKLFGATWVDDGETPFKASSTGECKQ